MQVETSVACPKWGADLPEAAEIATSAIRSAVSVAGFPAGAGWEVSVVLGDDNLQQRLNRDWRGRDQTTNVLAFPLHAPAALRAPPTETLAKQSLGDIVLCHSVVRAEAERDGKTLGDHLAHLVVHGCLHLLGFDHHAAAEADEMEALERRALAALGIADPYVLNLPELPETAESRG